MTALRRRNEDPMKRARTALDRVGIEIEYDERDGTTDGEEAVGHGLDAMASALGDLKGLQLDGAAPLDMVLAEIGAEDDLVENTAQLIELIGRASYTGLSRRSAEEAEELRGKLYDALDGLLNEIEEQPHA